METITVNINTPFIKLDQLLKYSGVAQTGAMAKEMILDGFVRVNKEICTMRGKKIYPHTCVELAEQNIFIVVQGQ